MPTKVSRKKFQQIFEPEPQDAMEFACAPEQSLQFPLSLVERYQPTTIDTFVGLDRPKALFNQILSAPRHASLLLVGPPGSGKTTMGMAFAEQLPGALKHLAAQRCDVSTLETLRDQLAFTPAGGWWIVLIDEIDCATEKAQLQLLSWLDGTAALKPVFGGGFVRGEAPQVIYIMTCNGCGPNQTIPPTSLLPRFQSRCMTVEFDALSEDHLAPFLERIWLKEGDEPQSPEWYRFMSRGVGVRDALMRLDTDLLAGPRSLPAPLPAMAEPAPVRLSHLNPAQKAWETRRLRAQTLLHSQLRESVA